LKIYLKDDQVGEIKGFIFKMENRYFSLLKGINIVPGAQLNIEPVYQSLVNFNAHPGILAIETPWFALLLMERYPFVHIEAPSGTALVNK